MGYKNLLGKEIISGTHFVKEKMILETHSGEEESRKNDYKILFH